MSTSLELREKSKSAAKWSFVTEVLAKVVSPISQLILVRLLEPSAFGMVATVTMVVSFADMFSDAGFQKYLIQHDFKNNLELHRYADVAFWTNLIISLALWGLIAWLRDPVSSFVGSPKLGAALAIACGSLPLTSFSSIQRSLFQRRLDFKSIMPARLMSAIAILAITVMLALLGFDYWSLIVGTLLGNLVMAAVLTIKSDWRPRLYYSVDSLVRMLSFSMWTMVESLVIWLSTWAGSFIIGNALGVETLGFYRTPVSLISGCFAIVTGATTPILFSALSRLQNDMEEYFSYLYRFQAIMALFLVPLSAGLFVYRGPLVEILLGDQWIDSELAFGLYGLLQGPMVLLSYYCSEVYRSLGKPKVSTLVQLVFLIIMVPAMVWAAGLGFEAVVWTDAATRMVLLVTNQIVSHMVVGTSVLRMVKSLAIPCVGSIAMACTAYVTKSLASNGFSYIILSMLCAAATYVAVVMVIPKSRGILLDLVKEEGLD